METPSAAKLTPATPSTAETNETSAGTTWFSYFSEEKQREYFHEPVSGVVSWTAPTCSPSGITVLQRQDEEEEDSHNTPPLKEPFSEERKNGATTKDFSTSSTIQKRLIYWALAIFATNLMLQVWTHYSLDKSIAEQVDSIQTEPHTQSVAPLCEPVACEPVACEPVTCEPVACEPVTCEPVACEPVTCEPVACESVACESVACDPMACEPTVCEPVVCAPCEPPPPPLACPEQKVVIQEAPPQKCLPQSARPEFDFERSAATSQYVQRIVDENAKALFNVWQHVQTSLPLDEVSKTLPNICEMPLAKRMVPECLEEDISSA